MRSVILITLLVALAVTAACFAAEGKKEEAKVPAAVPAESPHAADEKAIRASAEAFVAAFNRADPKAIGAMWTVDCEYMDEAGWVFRGREAIEKEYAGFFAENPGAKMENAISSIKVVGRSVAIETGTSTVKNAEGALLSRGSYNAVLLKDDDKWLMASVREHVSPSLSVRPRLADLEWLIGDWAGTKESKTVDFAFKWIADKEFIELAYATRDKEGVARSGIQIIGRDPSSCEVASWSFDSTGGLGQGHWRLLKNGCLIESVGLMPDGTPVSSTDILSKVDGNSFTWQSMNRTAAGQKLNDTEALVMKRKSR